MYSNIINKLNQKLVIFWLMFLFIHLSTLYYSLIYLAPQQFETLFITFVWITMISYCITILFVDFENVFLTTQIEFFSNTLIYISAFVTAYIQLFLIHRSFPGIPFTFEDILFLFWFAVIIYIGHAINGFFHLLRKANTLYSSDNTIFSMENLQTSKIKQLSYALFFYLFFLLIVLVELNPLTLDVIIFSLKQSEFFLLFLLPNLLICVYILSRILTNAIRNSQSIISFMLFPKLKSLLNLTIYSIIFIPHLLLGLYIFTLSPLFSFMILITLLEIHLILTNVVNWSHLLENEPEDKVILASENLVFRSLLL